MNPSLGKSINLDSFEPLVKISREANVEKFIYASSSSVYGISKEKNVTEDLDLKPLTDYSKYKALCEKYYLITRQITFVKVIRPATVCGYSVRQRIDVVVNILTNLAYNKNKITVYGGDQLRPNIHIDDMIRSYELMITSDVKLINKKIYNIGFDNFPVVEIANKVKTIIGKNVELNLVPTNDIRSYHISSKKIKDERFSIKKYR